MKLDEIADWPSVRSTSYAEGVESRGTDQPIDDDGAHSAVDFLDDGMLKSRNFELHEIQDDRDVSIERITAES